MLLIDSCKLGEIISAAFSGILFVIVFPIMKKVRFDNLEAESVKFMAREILVLRRLDHPNVVKLEGLVTSRISSSLYLVFEYMEHDLAGLAAGVGVKFSEPQVPLFYAHFPKFSFPSFINSSSFCLFCYKTRSSFISWRFFCSLSFQ